MAKETYREVYEKHNGPIPKGKIIHHLNGQHNDDRPDNLIALSRGHHFLLHRLMKQLPLELLWRIGEGLLDFVKQEAKKQKELVK